MLVKGNLQQLVLSSDIERLRGARGCLSGNVPAERARARRAGVDGPCGQLARAHTVKVVLGPGTFINEAANQIDEQLAAPDQAGRRRRPRRPERSSPAPRSRAGCAPQKRSALGRQASKITMARFQEGLVTLALQYGLTGAAEPRPTPTSSRRSCSTPSKPAGTPKQRFAYLFPSRERGARLGAHAAPGSQRGAAHAHDRADPPGGGDAAVAPAARRAPTWSRASR